MCEKLTPCLKAQTVYSSDSSFFHLKIYLGDHSIDVHEVLPFFYGYKYFMIYVINPLLLDI